MFCKLQVTLCTHKTHHQNVFQAANNTIYAEEIDLAKTFDDVLLSPLFFWGLLTKESRSVAACFLFLDGPASSLLAILKTFQLADCAGLLWMLRVDRFAAHVALASTKNRYYSIAWLRPSFFLSLYCSQWKRRSWDSLETDKTRGRFWVFVSGRFCDQTEEQEKLHRAEDLPPKTEGLAPLGDPCVYRVHVTTQTGHVSQPRRPMCIQGAQDHTDRTYITTKKTHVCTACAHDHTDRTCITTQETHVCTSCAQDHTERTCITTKETHVCTSCAQDHTERTCITTKETHVCTSCAQDHTERTCITTQETHVCTSCAQDHTDRTWITTQETRRPMCVHHVHRTTQTGHVSQHRRPMCVHHVHRTTPTGHVSQHRRPGDPCVYIMCTGPHRQDMNHNTGDQETHVCTSCAQDHTDRTCITTQETHVCTSCAQDHTDRTCITTQETHVCTGCTGPHRQDMYHNTGDPCVYRVHRTTQRGRVTTQETHVCTGCVGPHREDVSQPRRPMCVHHVHRTTQRGHVSQHRRPMCVQGAQDHTDRTWITTQETRRPMCVHHVHRTTQRGHVSQPRRPMCVHHVHRTTQRGHVSQPRRPMCVQGAQDHTDRTWITTQETHVYTGCTGPHRQDMNHNTGDPCVYRVHRTTQTGHESQHRRPMCIQGAQDHTDRTWITTQETHVCTGYTGPHRQDMYHYHQTIRVLREIRLGSIHARGRCGKKWASWHATYSWNVRRCYCVSR